MPPTKAVAGDDQAVPPVDRLTTIESGFDRQSGAWQASEDTSQTPCLASKATLASVARAKVPGEVVNTVRPGRNPEVHVAPAFCDVANPMADEPPPPKNRPDWKTATTVLPTPRVWASTSVACSLEALVNRSELT